jgi:GNAT superfamily N-acetyltransferase
MPIIVETISTPSDQDWLDLQKIYHDLPHQTELAADAEALKQHIQTRLAQGDELFAARFNDRLLASCWLGARLEGQKYGELSPRQISDFCVRKVTRRRGVGLQFMQTMINQQPDKAITIYTAPSHDESGLHALLTRIGFEPLADNPEIWRVQQ